VEINSDLILALQRRGTNGRDRRTDEAASATVDEYIVVQSDQEK